MRAARNNLLKAIIFIAAVFTVGSLLWLLIYIIANGVGSINMKFLTDVSGDNKGGILPEIVTTLYMMLIAVAVACPIGIAAAIYLTEYAKQGAVIRLIRFATECLAGIPSIIYGLFGFLFFGSLGLRFTLIGGAITLSIMVLPTVIRATEEAIKAVPSMYREGSYGLGATKLRTVFNIVLPTAIPGILAAVILSMGRVVGETAVVILTAGTFIRKPGPFLEAVFGSGRSLAVHMYQLASQGISFKLAYATATVLIIIVALMNFLATYLAKKLKRV